MRPPDAHGILPTMDDRTVLVLNGPNLNLLGEREPEVYGRATLADVEALCRAAAERAGLTVDFRQTNSEGTLIDWVQEGRAATAGIVINAAGYTHTSVALRDALLAVHRPFWEVHLSDPWRRDEFRKVNFLHDIATATIAGHGALGYLEALDQIAAQGGGPA